MGFLSLSASGVLLAMLPCLIFAQSQGISDDTTPVRRLGMALKSYVHGEALVGAAKFC